MAAHKTSWFLFSREFLRQREVDFTLIEMSRDRRNEHHLSTFCQPRFHRFDVCARILFPPLALFPVNPRCAQYVAVANKAEDIICR